MKPSLRRLLQGLLVLFPVAAHADPRLDEKVYDPYVLKGVWELEGRTAREIGGPMAGATTSVLEAEYGVSDRVSLAVVAGFARDTSGPLAAESVGVEARVSLGQIPRLGIDTGLYLEAGRGVNGGESAAEAKLLLAKTSGRFQGLLNLIVERPIGAPSGEGYATYGYAVSATWRTIGALRLGAEAFGDFGSDRAFLGRQGAYVGPQVKWKGRPGRSPVEIEIDAGWLAAVGTDRREAASQVRFSIEFERRF